MRRESSESANIVMMRLTTWRRFEMTQLVRQHRFDLGGLQALEQRIEEDDPLGFPKPVK